MLSRFLVQEVTNIFIPSSLSQVNSKTLFRLYFLVPRKWILSREEDIFAVSFCLLFMEVVFVFASTSTFLWLKCFEISSIFANLSNLLFMETLFMGACSSFLLCLWTAFSAINNSHKWVYIGTSPWPRPTSQCRNLCRGWVMSSHWHIPLSLPAKVMRGT